MSSKLVVFRSSWTHGPELAQVLYDLYAWEKAQARNELVRVCYSERLVGLPRNKKIITSVHPRAAQEFARRLEAEGITGETTLPNKTHDKSKMPGGSKEATLFPPSHRRVALRCHDSFIVIAEHYQTVRREDPKC